MYFILGSKIMLDYLKFHFKQSFCEEGHQHRARKLFFKKTKPNKQNGKTSILII